MPHDAGRRKFDDAQTTGRRAKMASKMTCGFASSADCQSASIIQWRLFRFGARFIPDVCLAQQRKMQLNNAIMRSLVRMHDAPLRIPAHAHADRAT
jgi:hypothetical protein